MKWTAQTRNLRALSATSRAFSTSTTRCELDFLFMPTPTPHGATFFFSGRPLTVISNILPLLPRPRNGSKNCGREPRRGA